MIEPPPQAQAPDYKFSAKLPLLLSGIVALVLGLGWFIKRPWAWPAFGLVVLGLVLVLASESMGDWCQPKETTFGGAFSGEAFAHHGLKDCVRLVFKQ